MSNFFEERQAQIDALMKITQVDRIPVQKHLLGLARIGMEKPEGLTSDETKQVCFALVAHYHQMGIS